VRIDVSHAVEDRTEVVDAQRVASEPAGEHVLKRPFDRERDRDAGRDERLVGVAGERGLLGGPLEERRDGRVVRIAPRLQVPDRPEYRPAGVILSAKNT
jgi:hypothetical protein